MGVKIGFVTVGQSPRADVVPEIARRLGRRAGILEVGALDGLSREEIRNLKPGEGDFRLITRLKDGSTAVVGKKKILPFLRRAIDRLAAQDVRLIALLCTDEFPSIGRQNAAGRIVLQPSLLLRSAVVARLKEGRLGVFAPLEEQKVAIRHKWKKTGLGVVVEALNPYQESGESERAIRRMRKEMVDLIVLDCIGYSSGTKVGLERILDRPVLLPRAVLAGAIERWRVGQSPKARC